MSKKKVSLGSKIEVLFDDGGREIFELVSSDQADIWQNKILIESLFGQTILGRSEGETVSYLNNSNKNVCCEILKIEEPK